MLLTKHEIVYCVIGPMILYTQESQEALRAKNKKSCQTHHSRLNNTVPSPSCLLLIAGTQISTAYFIDGVQSVSASRIQPSLQCWKIAIYWMSYRVSTCNHRFHSYDFFCCPDKRDTLEHVVTAGFWTELWLSPFQTTNENTAVCAIIPVI